MSTFESMLFVLVAVAGLVALRWARRSGEAQKSRYESEACDRVHRSLSKLAESERQYRFYALVKKQWEQTDSTILKSQIVEDCTRRNSDGPSYGNARYSLFTDSRSNSVYYVVGTNSFEFTDLPHGDS